MRFALHITPTRSTARDYTTNSRQMHNKSTTDCATHVECQTGAAARLSSRSGMPRRQAPLPCSSVTTGSLIISSIRCASSRPAGTRSAVCVKTSVTSAVHHTAPVCVVWLVVWHVWQVASKAQFVHWMLRAYVTMCVRMRMRARVCLRMRVYALLSLVIVMLCFVQSGRRRRHDRHHNSVRLLPLRGRAAHQARHGCPTGQSPQVEARGRHVLDQQGELHEIGKQTEKSGERTRAVSEQER